MKHEDFQVGSEFYTCTGRWRCTDVGTRVIVAVSLEHRTLLRTQRMESGRVVKEEFASDDPSDLVGPPYMVEEHVFDEFSIGGCFKSRAEASR